MIYDRDDDDEVDEGCVWRDAVARGVAQSDQMIARVDEGVYQSVRLAIGALDVTVGLLIEKGASPADAVAVALNLATQNLLRQRFGNDG